MMDEDGYATQGCFDPAKQRFGLPGPPDELLATYRRTYLDACTPDDAVFAALSTLRERGWRVGIVTDDFMPHQAQG